MANQLRWRPTILHMLILFLPTVLWYNKLSMSKNHTGISFITSLHRKNSWYFKIWNSGWITEDLDNWGSIVFSTKIHLKTSVLPRPFYNNSQGPSKNYEWLITVYICTSVGFIFCLSSKSIQLLYSYVH